MVGEEYGDNFNGKTSTEPKTRWATDDGPRRSLISIEEHRELGRKFLRC